MTGIYFAKRSAVFVTLKARKIMLRSSAGDTRQRAQHYHYKRMNLPEKDSNLHHSRSSFVARDGRPYKLCQQLISPDEGGKRTF